MGVNNEKQRMGPCQLMREFCRAWFIIKVVGEKSQSAAV